MTNLAQLRPGQSGVVCCTELSPPDARRLSQAGIVPGRRVRVLARLPLGGPVVVAVDWGMLALERELAVGVRLVAGGGRR
ncbi:MAG: FeoA family protein [Bacillota bacterium]